MKSRRPKARVY